MPARLLRCAGLLTLSVGLPLLGWAAEPQLSLRPWNRYHVIMWVGDSVWKQPAKLPLFLERLRQMGVDTAMVFDGANPAPYVTNHFPYYVENIVNKGLCLKWNSKVAHWDRFVTQWAHEGRPASAFVRQYCLDDPTWRAWAEGEMRAAARRNGPHAPLAYNIRDELSVTLSANPFDYDFSPAALAGFRRWLQTEYANLSALNAEWATRFTTWAQVMPFSTDEIKNRQASGAAEPQGQPNWQAVERCHFNPETAGEEPTRWNFAPWCDFRSYMDLSLARTLGDLRAAAHAVDPQTPVGIEGTQMPDAFGGYDLWRLSQVLDWVEPYDIGNAREIFASFMRGKPIVTTVFEKQTRPAQRRLWHLLLEGDRGCIVWWSEDCIDWSRPDYPLTAKAKALAPVLREMKTPLAQLFLRARREFDPIAFVYSQPSIQVDWLLESTRDGSTWPRRFSSFEANHNRMVKVRDAWLKAFQDLGYSPRFIPAAQLEQAAALNGVQVLVLPTVRALSTAEISGIEHFLRTPKGGTPRLVFADGLPGMFDQHGRLRRANPLATWFPTMTSAQGCVAVRGTASIEPGRPLTPSLFPGGGGGAHRRSGVTYGPEGRVGEGESQAKVSTGDAENEEAPHVAMRRRGDIATYRQDRLTTAPRLQWAQWIRRELPGPRPAVTIPLEARVRVHRFRLGSARLLAFERNIDYQMSEDLKQAGGNEALERPIKLTARLASDSPTRWIYDLRAGHYIGRTNRWTFTLDPWKPSLFALLPHRMPAARVIPTLLGR